MKVSLLRSSFASADGKEKRRILGRSLLIARGIGATSVSLRLGGGFRLEESSILS